MAQPLVILGLYTLVLSVLALLLYRQHRRFTQRQQSAGASLKEK